MPRARADDLDLYYEMHGEGAPLALFMGLGGNIAMWDVELIEALARHFRVLVFDNRGTGRSDKPDHPYSMAMFAADAAALFEAVGVQRAHVLGASMGGMIAQQFALDHPRRVDRLVLGCTTAGGARMALPAEEVLAALANVDGLPPAELARSNRRYAYTAGYLAAHEAEFEARLPREVEFPTPPFALSHHLGAAAHFDVYDRLPEIRHPTLVMTGREDAMIPAANSVLLAERIPQADLIIYGRAGHGFMSERRDDVIRDVVAFLERQ